MPGPPAPPNRCPKNCKGRRPYRTPDLAAVGRPSGRLRGPWACGVTSCAGGDRGPAGCHGRIAAIIGPSACNGSCNPGPFFAQSSPRRAFPNALQKLNKYPGPAPGPPAPPNRCSETSTERPASSPRRAFPDFLRSNYEDEGEAERKSVQPARPECPVGQLGGRPGSAPEFQASFRRALARPLKQTHAPLE